jgi:phospholipase/lecithinase/hemolysin
MVKCQFKDCTVKNAQFGFENNKPKFCSKHKEDGMIDLKHPKCIKCKNIQPVFGFEGG